MKESKKSKFNIKIPTLKLRYRLLLYTAAVLFSLLSLISVNEDKFPYIMEMILYVLAAGTLFPSCYYLTVDIKYGIKEKIKPGMEANFFTNRLTNDYSYRTIIFAFPGLLLNVIFAVFNAFVGVSSHSAWFGTMAAYYILLSVMRFRAVWYNRKAAGKEKEIAVYRTCGVLFIIMTAALLGAVILLIHSEGGKNYPGFTIYAVAAYTFYKIIISAINMVKAGKLKSPILMTIRDIGYIDACVSVLLLQTAMFSSFGNGQEDFAKWMNGITGMAVCLIVLIMGLHCIYSALQMNKELSEETGGSESDKHTGSRG